MKNSAWYHKLWRDKLRELPLKKDDAAAWADMRNLLDEQLPVNATSTGINAYKLSTLVKAVLVLVIAAIITVPVIVLTNKHNTNSSKNNKHLPARVTGHNLPDKLSGRSSTQHLKDLTISDSTFNPGSSVERLTENQKNAINSSAVNDNPITVNQDPQSLNPAGLKTNSNHYRRSSMAASGKLLNSASASGNANSSQYIGFKSTGKHSGGIVRSDKHNYQHSPIPGYGLSTNYISKHNQDFATKSISKPDASGRYTPPVTNIDGKNTIAGNTTAGSGKTSNLNNDKEAADTKIDPVKSPVNNTDTKEVKSSGSRSRAFNTSPKTVKTKENKTKSNTKKTKADNIPPKYNYGLEAGYNAGKGHNLYAGIFGSYQIKPGWLINAGLRLNTYRTISGEYSHKSYYSPDSIPDFKVNDSRKVMALTIPVTLEYKLTKNISLKGGPVISLPVKQSGISTKLGDVPNIRDTVYHTPTIDSALRKTTINKLNVGFTGGVSIQIKHFSIEAMYQVLTPYKVSSGLGSYQKSNQSFQIGIGYRFK